jgi:hypothetical protein
MRKTIGSSNRAKPLTLCIDGNPAANIHDIEKVVTVFKDGVGYDPAKLVKAANGTVGLR